MEIWLNIFKYCTYNDVVSCTTIHPYWRDVISNEYFWESIAKYTIMESFLRNNAIYIMSIDMMLDLQHGNFSLMDIFNNITVESGQYKYGKMIGRWKSLYIGETETVQIQKEYNDNNQEHGERITEYRAVSGIGFSTYTMYANGSRHGTYTKWIVFNEPDRPPVLDTVGEYTDNRRSGEWEWYNTVFIDQNDQHPDLMVRGVYRDGLRHGYWHYYPDGHFDPLVMISGLYINNRMEGRWTALYDDDQMPSGWLRVHMTADRAFELIRDTISNSFLEE